MNNEIKMMTAIPYSNQSVFCDRNVSITIKMRYCIKDCELVDLGQSFNDD